MNNSLIRLAALRTASEPNNIVKVAGLLTKIKRWILKAIDPATRSQIGIIDAKYSELQSDIRNLQENIAAIEDAIDNVDLATYDLNVAKLSETLQSLSVKIGKTTEAIQASQADKAARTAPNQNETINQFFVKGEKLKDLKGSKINISSLEYNSSSGFYNSLRGKTEDGTPLGEARSVKFFKGDEAILDEFVEKAQQEQVFERIVIPDIVNKYHIISVKEPLPKEKTPRRMNAALIELGGRSVAKVGDKEVEIGITVQLDVFIESLQEIRDPTLKIYKVYVWGIKGAKNLEAAKIKPPSSIEPKEVSGEG